MGLTAPQKLAVQTQCGFRYEMWGRTVGRNLGNASKKVKLVF